MFKPFESICRDLLIVFLLAAPAWAQFEINPDHFNDENSKQVAASSTELQAQLKEAHARFLDYNAHLKAKAERVEEARLEVISAGIQGDGAGSYIDAWRQQQSELKQLQESLAPEISRAEATLAGLQQQLMAASAPAQLDSGTSKNAKPHPVTARKRPHPGTLTQASARLGR